MDPRPPTPDLDDKPAGAVASRSLPPSPVSRATSDLDDKPAGAVGLPHAPILSTTARPAGVVQIEGFQGVVQIGGFRIDRQIGSGGMGMVYEAIDVTLSRRAAVKILHPAFACRPVYRQRILREGRALAAIQSEHVVTIYQVGEQDGLLFLAMELLEGAHLEGWLQANGPPDERVVLGMAREILTGLAAAHEKGILHRDIKPTNLWVERRTGRVKLFDFGLTCEVDVNDNLTSPGAVLGTAAYMAPEQAREQRLDERADLFSVGVVLYRMIAGVSPFARSTRLESLVAVTIENPPPLSDVSPALNQFIARLLAKDPNDRPTTAVAALAEIHDVERMVGPTKLGGWITWLRNRFGLGIRTSAKDHLAGDSQSPIIPIIVETDARRPPSLVVITDRPEDRTRRVREHCDYLDRMAAEEVVPRSVAEAAHAVWYQASVTTDDLIPIPPATAVEGGPIRYTWDRGDHHLEAEISEGGPVEWFYQNRKTGEVWSADVPVTDAFPPPLCTRLFRVALTSDPN